MDVLKRLKAHYQKKMPFVLYKKPDEKTISGLFQLTNELFITNDYSESGFIFAPFNNKQKAILIPKSKSKLYCEEINITDDFCSEEDKKNIDENLKQQHTNLIEKGIEAINKGEFKKVVLSRKEIVETHNFNLINTYKLLISKYPEAFVYAWFHPKIGLWLGATPETLLKTKGNNFETMALAGTQQYKQTLNVAWTQKEIDEQQFVTDFIVKKASKVCKNIIKYPTKTVRAGSLVHLQTKITGSFTDRFKKQDNSLFQLVSSLHPTPAVCGFPKGKTKKYIIDNELYDREFYTGFLGELNFTSSEVESCKNSQLFVNLRCMKVLEKKAIIYIGGGITKDSKPIKEWEETVNKSYVMKKILKDCFVSTK